MINEPFARKSHEQGVEFRKQVKVGTKGCFRAVTNLYAKIVKLIGKVRFSKNEISHVF